MEKQNIVAKVLRVIGIAIMIGGFFLALTTGFSQNLGMALPVLFSSFVTGMLFIGFSEVIALLQKIYLQLYKSGTKVTATSSTEPEIEQPQEQIKWHPSGQDLVDIQEIYSGQKITKIEASPYEDYCVVQIEGEDQIEVVELGGFKPKKVSAASQTGPCEQYSKMVQQSNSILKRDDSHYHFGTKGWDGCPCIVPILRHYLAIRKTVDY